MDDSTVPIIPPEWLLVSKNNTRLSYVRPIDAGGFGQVHELSDLESGKVNTSLFSPRRCAFLTTFLVWVGLCSQVILLNGTITEEEIQNEMRAVSKLCMGSTHKNIVSVFDYGPLSHFSYFIDMELCDLNLERWIYQSWNESAARRLPHLAIDLPPRARMGQIWDIMEDITRAVALIHDAHEVHRDLKPSNVLYSLANEAWKVTDFGFTMEGFSSRALTSYTSRGTTAYRAPELLNRTSPEYTNKVDMWDVGCILYELVVRRRAFRDDWVVYDYAKSGTDFDTTLVGECVPEDQRRAFVCKVIKELLDVNPSKRPKARELYERFISWGADSVLTHNQAPPDAPGGPIPESPTDVVVHDVDVQSHSLLSDEPPKKNEYKSPTSRLPDPSKLSPEELVEQTRIGSPSREEADRLSDQDQIDFVALFGSSRMLDSEPQNEGRGSEEVDPLMEEAQLPLNSGRREDEITPELPPPAPYQQRHLHRRRNDSPRLQSPYPQSGSSTQVAISSSTAGKRMTGIQHRPSLEEEKIKREPIKANRQDERRYYGVDLRRGPPPFQMPLRVPTPSLSPLTPLANLHSAEMDKTETDQAESVRPFIRDDYYYEQMSMEASEQEQPDVRMPNLSFVATPPIAPLQNSELLQTSSLATSSQNVADSPIQPSSQSESYHYSDVQLEAMRPLPQTLILKRSVNGPITTNTRGTLVIIPIVQIMSGDERVYFLELWDIWGMKEIWTSPALALPYRKPVFSPDGTTFAYIDLGRKYHPLLSIWNVVESQVLQQETLDLSLSKQIGLDWLIKFNAGHVHEFAISNSGRRIAFTLLLDKLQHSGLGFWRCSYSAKVEIDFVYLLTECWVQYSDDDEDYLYKFDIIDSKYLSLYVVPGHDIVKYKYRLKGQTSADSLRNMRIMVCRRWSRFPGPLIVVAVKVHGDFRSKLRQMFSTKETTRFQILYIESKSYKLFYSTLTYESVEMVSNVLFVDSLRQTISNYPVPGEAIGGGVVPYSAESKEMLNRYHDVATGEGLSSLRPVQLRGTALICVNDQGELYFFGIDEWSRFMVYFKGT